MSIQHKEYYPFLKIVTKQQYSTFDYNKFNEYIQFCENLISKILNRLRITSRKFVSPIYTYC